MVFTVILVCQTLAASPSGFMVGRYDGSAFNTTAHARGKAVLEITAVNGPKVSAHFVASEGLSGQAFLEGAVDEHGVLHLTGALMQWTMKVDATRSGDRISAKYSLRGPSAQDGEFQVRYVGALAPPPKAALAQLVGTWEKQDGFAPPLDPLTHQPTGPRFEDGGTLVVGSDGSFQFKHLHNHCDSFGARCCRLDQLRWKGKLSLSGRLIVFDVASGDQLHSDSCNPALTRLTPEAAHEERYTFALRTAEGHPEIPALCWGAGDDWICFNKR